MKMDSPLNITKKLVLGTAQFGMDYGITNINGKPKKKEIFSILDLAWENGIRRFDTSPIYGSEALLGDFIISNGLQDEAILMTKIPSIGGTLDYQSHIKINIELSIKNLGCPIDILLLHDPSDSYLFIEHPKYFLKLLQEYPINTLGVSVYEPCEIENLSDSKIELAFQFPLNVIDRRFEKVSMPHSKRFARSIFLQGLLVSNKTLRPNVPDGLIKLQDQYFNKLISLHINPICFAISFVANNDSVDYFLVGVDSAKQLHNIINFKHYSNEKMSILDEIIINTDNYWFDPRNWS